MVVVQPPDGTVGDFVNISQKSALPITSADHGPLVVTQYPPAPHPSKCPVRPKLVETWEELRVPSTTTTMKSGIWPLAFQITSTPPCTVPLRVLLPASRAPAGPVEMAPRRS